MLGIEIGQGERRGEMELLGGTPFCIKTMKLVAVQSPAAKLLNSSKKEKLMSDFFQGLLNTKPIGFCFIL